MVENKVTKTTERKRAVKGKDKKNRSCIIEFNQTESWSINQLKGWELAILQWTLIVLWFNLLGTKCTVPQKNIYSLVTSQLPFSLMLDCEYLHYRQKRLVQHLWFRYCDEKCWTDSLVQIKLIFIGSYWCWNICALCKNSGLALLISKHTPALPTVLSELPENDTTLISTLFSISALSLFG